MRLEMPIPMECHKCGKNGGAGAALIASALNALMSNGEVTNDGTVVSAGAALVSALMDIYTGKGCNAAFIEAQLGLLAEALHNKEDDVVKALGVVNRQALWSVLGMLRKERIKCLARIGTP